MARFNISTKGSTKTVNKAGGDAYTQTAEMRLVSLLLTSFVRDQFYRTGKEQMDEIKALLKEVKPKFAAKAAVFARHEFGMRSISHVLAAYLAPYASGKKWRQKFYNKIVFRPDDMTEIASLYFGSNKRLSNAMRKGFKQSFNRFDAYQLGKYKGTNKAVTLATMAKLVHPVPNERNAEALKALVEGTLKQKGTWENKLSKAGTKKDVTKAKAKVWKDMIKNGKLGHMAAIRNIVNILEQAPDQIEGLCKIITNPAAISKSKMLPFNYVKAMTALDATAGLPRAEAKKSAVAIAKAFNMAISNVPTFGGRTLIVLDDSGSMGGSWGYDKSKAWNGMKPIQIASMFASILYAANPDADFMRFASNASYKEFDKLANPFQVMNDLIMSAKGGGTNFSSIFNTANKAYDRIIILSDMQSWLGKTSTAYTAYKNRFGVDPYIYSFDLAGYGSIQFPRHKTFEISGFSDKVFDIMELLEQDKNALIKAIKAIKL